MAVRVSSGAGYLVGVRHGTDADTERPDVAQVVWTGTVDPNNRQPGDIVLTAVVPPPSLPSAPPADLDYHAVYWAGGIDAATEVATGNVVADWMDLSGNAYHLNASTANRRPVYSASDAALNNKASLTFDGVANSMSVVTWANLTQPFTVCAVVKCSALDVSSQQLIDSLTATSGERLHVQLNRTSKRAIGVNGTYTLADNADTTKHLATAVFDGASSRLEVDGTQVATMDAGTALLPSLRVASNRLSNADFFKGKLGALAFINGTSYASFETWAASQYALTIT